MSEVTGGAEEDVSDSRVGATVSLFSTIPSEFQRAPTRSRGLCLRHLLEWADMPDATLYAAQSHLTTQGT